MSVVSILGLALGVAVLVVVLSVLNGFERELRTRVLGLLPQGIVYHDRGYVDVARSIETFMKHPEVVAAAPMEEGGALAVANGKLVGISYTGIDPDYEQGVSILPGYIQQGELADLTPSAFKIILGAELATSLGVSIGDPVTIVLPEVRMTMAGIQPRTKRFEVAGIFEVGADADASQAFISLADALVLNRKRQVTAIRIKVNDLFQAPRIVRELMLTSQEPLYGGSWMRRHGNLYEAIQTQKTTLFYLLLLLVVVAAFNVISNLTMIVNDKLGQIAIMRTMGASSSSILWVFIVHGALLGLVGIITGLVLGLLLTSQITPLYQFIDSAFSLGLMDEYFIHYLPVDILVSDIAMITATAFAICLLTTVYPAFKAARSHPVEALRYE